MKVILHTITDRLIAKHNSDVPEKYADGCSGTAEDVRIVDVALGFPTELNTQATKEMYGESGR